MTFQPDTALIHHSYQPPADFEAPQVPVCKASTVFFPSVAAMRERTWLDKSAYTYGLHGTPTSYVLEERLCALEGGRYAVLVPSGLAAIACVNLALLRMGDEMLRLARPLGGAIDGHLVILAGYGERHLSLKIEMILPAEPHAALHPARRAFQRCGRIAALQRQRREDLRMGVLVEVPDIDIGRQLFVFDFRKPGGTAGLLVAGRAGGLGGTAPDPPGRDAQLWGHRPRAGRRGRRRRTERPCGGHGERPQSAGHCRSVPPCYRCGRKPDRLCGRAGPESMAAGP